MPERKWMARVFGKNPGSLHRALGVPEDEKISASALAEATHSRSPLMRKRAALAKTGARVSRARYRRKGERED